MAEIILGNSYKFADNAGYISIEYISNTKFIVAWSYNKYVYIRIGNIIDGEVQYGPIANFFANGSVEVNIRKLNNNKFIILYGGYIGSSWGAYGIIINLDIDDNLTINDKVTIVSGAGSFNLRGSIVLDENHVIICQQTGSSSSSVGLLNISGNSFTFGGGTSGQYYPKLIKINSTQAIFSYNYVSGHILKALKLDGDSLIISDSVSLSSGYFGAAAGMSRINDTKFIVYYPSNKSRVCTVIDNNITLGAVKTSINTKYDNGDQVDENNFLIDYSNKIYIGTIDNEILSFGNETNIDTDVTRTDLTYLGNNDFAIAYTTNIGSVKLGKTILKAFKPRTMWF
jgi:hypothetical protein